MQKYTNPIGEQPLHIGDPFIFLVNGKYYLTGSTAMNEGFEIYESPDLMYWKYRGWAWRKNENCWGEGDFWAPEIKQFNEKFYMTYSARVSGSHPPRRLMALAVSDSPIGPYRDLFAPWFDFGYSAIDGHIFVDDQPYLYFSQNGSRDGYDYGIIFGVALSRDLSRLESEPVQLLEASQNWERVNWARNRCNEGPTVFKHHGKYYMTYSANHTCFPAYGVGYATADSPMGPWTKADENPILATTPEPGVSGPGHNSIVPSPDGNELFLVYHSHADPAKPSADRIVNIDRLQIIDGKLRVLGPTRSPQALPSGIVRR